MSKLGDAKPDINKEYTDNIDYILNNFKQVQGHINNLDTDKIGLVDYINKLKILKEQGFDVENTITRLQFQLEQTSLSIDNLIKQKHTRMKLLLSDLVDINFKILSKRLIIKDDEREQIDDMVKTLYGYRKKETVGYSEIDEIVKISLLHTNDLEIDISKFDANIIEAGVYKNRNYDVGDLATDLTEQKNNLQSHYNQLNKQLIQLSNRHKKRTAEYIETLKKKAESIDEEQT